MAFSESVKLNVKQKANFTCCWCNNRGNKVDIHHIIPRSEGGPDDEDNAAPLCGSCHDLYGGNPDLRREIRLRRDHWYEICSSTNSHKFTSEGPLSINVISSHVGAKIWDQGNPHSALQFLIKLDLINQNSKPIILKNFKVSTFETSCEQLNYSLLITTLFFTENNNLRPIILPYPIQGEYLGLIAYQINVEFNHREKLKFSLDLDAFQDYTIKLSYTYYDITRVTYNASVLVQSTFQEFKNTWRKKRDAYQCALFQQKTRRSRRSL